MPELLLRTKLQPTFVASALLRRERLLQKLRRNTSARVVLVHGAAGSGKSSLLSDFVRQTEESIAWYSLNEEDRDPAVFQNYLLGALSECFPGCLDQTCRLAEGMGCFVQNVDAFATTFINDILAYQDPVALVLDDYHLVQSSPPVVELVQFLVRHGPPNLTFYMASRVLPELPLAFLRSKQALVEVRQADLHFTEEEIGQLFDDVWGLAFDAELGSLLREKTEGWVTALQLVAQTIRDTPLEQGKRYLETLVGKEAYIYDYLASEVFELQPEAVQQFLLYTSVPEKFCAPLCRVLTGEEDATKMLERLDSSRLFLVHLDSQRDWFRYHHLFRDFLKSRLERGDHPRRNLHLLTAGWLEKEGQEAAALPHFLEAGHYDEASALLERLGSELLEKGMQSTVEVWLEAIPSDLRCAHPGILTLDAELLDLRGDWPRAVKAYQEAIKVYRNSGNDESSARVIEKLSLCYTKYGDTKKLIELCEDGLAQCPESNEVLRALLLAWMGAALIQSGQQFERAYGLLEESHQLAFKLRDPRAISWACMTYGFGFHFPRGNYSEALKALNEGIDFFADLGWTMINYQLSMNKVVIQTFQGDLRNALELVEDALLMADRAGHVYVAKGLELCRAMVMLEGWRLKPCEVSLSRISDGQIPAQFLAWYYRTAMLLHNHNGNLEQAEVAAREMKRILEAQGEGLYAMECWLGYALVCHKRGRTKECKSWIERAEGIAKEAKAKFWTMKAAFLRAALHSDEKALGKALELSRENRYDAFWLADPWRLAVPLLVESVALAIHGDYAGGLLEQLGDRVYPTVLGCLESPREEVKLEAQRILGQLQSTEEQPITIQRAEDARELLRRSMEPTPELRIYTLGRFEVHVNGRQLTAIDTLRPQALRLFKYFLTHHDEHLATDRVTEIFWPDSETQKARHSLSVHVSLIRKALRSEEGAGDILKIVRATDGYHLEFGEHAELDIRQFQRMVSEGRALQRQGHPERCVARLLRAENLYKGDFLVDEMYEDWADIRRQQLRRDYVEVLNHLAGEDLQLRRYGDARKRYQQILVLEPLDETVLQKLLQCYSRAGDRAGALREYHAFKQTLKGDMDLEPSPATVQLVNELIRD